MCGICGVVHSKRSYRPTEAAVTAMRDVMIHRGPDDAGSFIGAGVALGSRRLAILDVSPRGHMPMNSPDGRYQIVHNGEVYNYRDLRPALAAKGYTFRSNTDTEVLLYLYMDRGAEMLPLLNGMFAFAIWDAHERSLFIARDRLGVKPLYYALRDGALYFASEEKALFEAGIPLELDPDTWDELLYFRYVAGERTPFAGIRRLLPGHYLAWQDGELRIRRWWSLEERAHTLREHRPPDRLAWYRATFDDSVNLRRISDVPVGVLLSGGLDSGSVAASLAKQSATAVSSFTVGFAEPGYDESALAREVAARWRLDYHALYVAPETLYDLVREAAWLNDEPLAHANDAHLFAIARYAKPHVTVLLSGEGADETLGGYVRYRPLHYARLFPFFRLGAHILPAQPGSRREKLRRFLALGSVDDFVLFNSCDVLPGELPGTRRPDLSYRQQVLAEAKRLYPGDCVRQVMHLDQRTFLCSLLDRNDRMTMGASIECRVPFLDYRLVEMLAALPTSHLIARGESKPLLRAALGDRLPGSVLQHPKWGFGVPWNRYLREREPFAELVTALPRAEIAGPLDRAWLQGATQRFLQGDDRNAALIRQMVLMTIWHETLRQRIGQNVVA